MKTTPTIYERTICGLSFFSLIRLAVFLAGGRTLMKHFKVRVGSVMGYFAFCRLG
ncbi:hypothetical protein D1AOALGA4SA_10922 [Olavius algarvensis Delta 1 endosymbiont]|nr:hypothetical protein D1AOALGA4SA_10922 [Olavius algarvensis Delta 1 endosymbiont]